jgi:hypothetical protein
LRNVTSKMISPACFPLGCPLSAICVYPLDCRFDYCTRNLFDREERRRAEKNETRNSENESHPSACRLRNNFDFSLFDKSLNGRKVSLPSQTIKTFSESSGGSGMFARCASKMGNQFFTICCCNSGAKGKQSTKWSLVVHRLSSDGRTTKGLKINNSSIDGPATTIERGAGYANINF